MRTLPGLALRLTTLLLCAAPALAQHEGHNHDHGATPQQASNPAQPRFTAVSETYELVGILNDRQLTLYLDHAADNSPVRDARLELEFGGAALTVTPHGEGEFEATLAEKPKLGEIPVTITVLAGDKSDLLATDFDLPDQHDEAHKASGIGSGKTITAWVVGGVLALGLAALIWRQRRNPHSVAAGTLGGDAA